MSEAMRPAAVDCAHELLSNSCRRYLLYRLLNTDRVDVDQYSRELAARERGVSTSAVNEAQRQQIAVSLVHVHLPKLSAHDVLQYDAERGDIVPAERFADLKPFLQHTRSREETTQSVSISASSQTSSLSD